MLAQFDHWSRWFVLSILAHLWNARPKFVQMLTGIRTLLILQLHTFRSKQVCQTPYPVGSSTLDQQKAAINWSYFKQGRVKHGSVRLICRQLSWWRCHRLSASSANLSLQLNYMPKLCHRQDGMPDSVSKNWGRSQIKVGWHKMNLFTQQEPRTPWEDPQQIVEFVVNTVGIEWSANLHGNSFLAFAVLLRSRSSRISTLQGI